MRPGLDLLSQVEVLPQGDVIDLGCGSGAVGAPLGRKFNGRRLIGVDRSETMLEKARKTAAYSELVQADANLWAPRTPPALIFSNALCHWLPDHATLFARLAGALVQGGVLAVQMPNQFSAPSHKTLRDVAQGLYADRFDFTGWKSPVAAPQTYAEMLSPLGAVSVWQTDYIQRLEPVETGHPVRHFTQSTALRPFADKLTEAELLTFIAAYEAVLQRDYPAQNDGSVLFPFKRLFFTLVV